MFRHLFWDMGGTMFDTYPQVDATLAQVVRDCGFTLSDIEVSHLTRRSTGEAISTLAQRFDIPAEEFRRIPYRRGRPEGALAHEPAPGYAGPARGHGCCQRQEPRRHPPRSPERDRAAPNLRYRGR